MTKKQRRAEERIRRAKERKEDRFRSFVINLARRRMKDPGDGRNIYTHFHCYPESLSMSRSEFLAKGQQLCGGVAVFFDRGELKDILPRGCDRRESPVVLMASYVQANYRENGRQDRGGEHD